MKKLLLEQKILKKFNEIKKFMYCPEYLNLGIYSRQYYKNIILNIFTNFDKDYSFIFGDFDKLSDINLNFGNKTGDKALYNALNVIKYSLPRKCFISRVAGDEFSIIIPNFTQNQSEVYKKLIHDNLDKYRSATCGLTITLGLEDSKKTKSAYELASITENKVSALKSKRCSLNNPILQTDLPFSDFPDSYWNELNLSVYHAIKNHISNLRLSDSFEYTEKDFKKEALYMIEELGNLIEKKQEIQNIDYNKLDSDCNIPSENAMLLHNLISSDNETSISEKLSKLDVKDLETLYSTSNELSDLLIRNPLSNLFSKDYLKSFMAKKISNSSSKYQAVFFSNIGVKASNTAYGHDYTDIRLKDSAQLLISSLNKLCNFNNNSFTFDNKDNFLFDYGGGNYIAFIEKSQSLSADTIKDCVSKINSNEDSLKFGYSICEDIQKEDYEMLINSIHTLKKQCNFSKDELKHEYIDNPDNVLAFNKEIVCCVNNYLTTIPNSHDISTKKQFLSNIFTFLLKEASKYKGKTSKNISSNKEER